MKVYPYKITKQLHKFNLCRKGVETFSLKNDIHNVQTKVCTREQRQRRALFLFFGQMSVNQKYLEVRLEDIFEQKISYHL